MTNTHNILKERNKELLNKIEELKEAKTEISREAQLKIIDKIQNWKKENYETGDRLKKYQGNTYPSHITDNTTDEWPLWRQLAGHVNFELNMVQYLDQKENPLDELLEMMLNSITRNVAGYYNLAGLKEKEVEEKWKLREEVKEITKEKETYFKISTDKKMENEELKEKLKELEEKVEELEERVEIEVETNLEALEISEKWNKRNLWNQQVMKDKIIFDLRIENQELRKKLDAIEESKKFKQTRKLLNKVKVKVKEKVKEKINVIKENGAKFETYVLEKFEAHILQKNK